MLFKMDRNTLIKLDDIMSKSLKVVVLFAVVIILLSGCSANSDINNSSNYSTSELELKEYNISVKSNIEEFDLGDNLKASIDYTYVKEDEIGSVYLYIGITKISEPTDSGSHNFDLTDFEVRVYDKYNSRLGFVPIDVTQIRAMSVGEKSELKVFLNDPTYDISEIDSLEIYKWFANWDN